MMEMMQKMVDDPSTIGDVPKINPIGVYLGQSDGEDVHLGPRCQG